MDFVSVVDAQRLLSENINYTEIEQVLLMESLGRYAALPILAPMDIPQFDNSAMDGYCFMFSDFIQGIPLRLIDTIQAGTTLLPQLKSGEAAHIFTGAPIPPGADTVVMQEKISVDDNILVFKSNDISRGLNIRLSASQTKKGTEILASHQYINAGIIGFLAGFGITHISVFSKPRIGICCTGKELVIAGSDLKPGQIYESNSISLHALLSEIKIDPIEIIRVEDDLEKTVLAISNLLSKVDIIILTGGISVGAYDFVLEALQKNQVEKIFYKVKQKPGKPLYFGRKGNQFVFALPGNPAATFTCFHQYAKPFIQSMMGKNNMYDLTQKGALDHSYTKKIGLQHFVKAIIRENKITILANQESYKMNAFVDANCLVSLDANTENFEKNDMLSYINI